jgi:glycine hydroxymethyltransferase
MTAYYALLQAGDTILGMALAHGGHLTHGAPVSFSGRQYRIVSYGVGRDTGTIDYDEVRALAVRERPKAIVAGASSYSRILDFAAFRAIADEVGAYLIVDMAHIAGLVAAGLHPSPFPHADIVTTTTHKTLRGPRGGLIFGRAELAKQIDRAVFPGTQGGPLMHIIAAKAVALREAQGEDFQRYQRRTLENAVELADTLRDHGAALVSGGTDNHLVLVDVTPLGVTGLEAEHLLDEVGITVNKNAIPFDPLPPNTASGIRVGSPATTTRGFGRAEMREVGELLVRALRERDDPAALAHVSREVQAICARFPVPALASA